MICQLILFKLIIIKILKNNNNFKVQLQLKKKSFLQKITNKIVKKLDCLILKKNYNIFCLFFYSICSMNLLYYLNLHIINI